MMSENRFISPMAPDLNCSGAGEELEIGDGGLLATLTGVDGADLDAHGGDPVALHVDQLQVGLVLQRGVASRPPMEAPAPSRSSKWMSLGRGWARNSSPWRPGKIPLSFKETQEL